jgi:hypothetical protein
MEPQVDVPGIAGCVGQQSGKGGRKGKKSRRPWLAPGPETATRGGLPASYWSDARSGLEDRLAG